MKFIDYLFRKIEFNPNQGYAMFYYRNGETCSEERDYHYDTGKWDSPTCSVYNVDYRVEVYIDLAGNVSPKLYIYSVWVN